jgi:hypothetical protein
MTLVICLPTIAAAQSPSWIRLGANGILLYTRVDPVPRNRSLGEIRATQVAIMAHGGAFSNRLRLLATVNLEGLTMPDGELTPGAWGEGFIDRRHPHTYLHELILSTDDLLGSLDGAARLSLAAGKGFAPFGTDDPMVRPAVRYPVNHHLAQILERAVAIAGVRAGPLAIEAGLFNGDEPERPGQWPRVSRFGDSWSGRVTVLPTPGVELQGSYARVHSPEHRPGSGSDQHKGRAGSGLTRSTVWSNGPGRPKPRGSSSSTAFSPRVHGLRAVAVSSTVSSVPNARRRSGPWISFARRGLTSRIRFWVFPAGPFTRRATALPWGIAVAGSTPCPSWSCHTAECRI